MPCLVDTGIPLLQTVFHLQKHNIHSVSADLLHRSVVHLEHILNNLVLAFFNRSLLIAGSHHHQNVLFRDFFLLLRADSQQLKNSVGRYRKQPYEGLKDLCHHGQNSRQSKRHCFGIMHGNTLRHQLAEYNTEISKQQGNQEDKDAS